MPLSYEANEDRGVQDPRHNRQNQRPPKALHTCPCSPNTDICPGTPLNSRVHDSGQWSLACSRSSRTEGAHRVPNRVTGSSKSALRLGRETQAALNILSRVFYRRGVRLSLLSLAEDRARSVPVRTLKDPD